ncbi:MAG: methyltransferase domain-containing protein [Gemmatimonadota bacterium]
MRPARRVPGWDDTSTALHEERLDGVMSHLSTPEVETVLDLGCGSGALLERLAAEPRLRRIVGIDRSLQALQAARERLTHDGGSLDARLALRQGSVTDADADLVGFDAAVLVETIEHLEPTHLSLLERSILTRLRPARVVITTPNREYNVLYGLGSDEYRHPHHRFEWDRAKFEGWVSGASGRNGYRASFEGIGPRDHRFGSPTQMAILRRDPA